MPLQQGSMSNMTEVRSYTNGSSRSGASESEERGAGDFVNALQDAVQKNPISAALIGMGVLWMFMGGSNTSLFGGSGRKSIFRTAGHSAEELGGALRDTAARVGSSIGQAGHAAAETTSQAARGVGQGSAAIGERASQTIEQASDLVSSAYDATTETASRTAKAISNATTSAAHVMQETGTRFGSAVQQNIADLFERQPLLLGAVGIAIGAGIAASIPTTEAENKIMGGASDLVRETVSEKAVQVKEMAEAAVGEAKAQGLTPEAAGEALRTIGDKVGRAATQAATSPSTSKKNLS
jgi:hypothetical protein